MINALRGALAAAVLCAALGLAAPVAQAKVHHHHRHAAAAAGHRPRHHAGRHGLGHVATHGRHGLHGRRGVHGRPAFESHRRRAALCQSVMIRRHWVQRCRG
jgi:hypothetical protein